MLRTGTTYLSTLINSQNDGCCIEMSLNFIKDIKDEQDKIIFNSNIHTLNPGLDCFDIPFPIIKKFPISKEKVIESVIDHFANHYNVNNFGFKKTLLSQKDILQFKKNGFKIIVLRRNIDDQFFSYTHYANKNSAQASITIKDYLKSIDFYEFKKLNKEDFILVDYENLMNNNKESTLKKLSEYLGFKIDHNKPLFTDFEKNLNSPIIKKWKTNTSFHPQSNISKNYKNKKKENKIFTDFILGKNLNLRLNFMHLISKLRKILIFFLKYLK